MDDDTFLAELEKLITELAARPVEIDSRRVRWCLDRGISPFAAADGKHERWQLVTDEDLAADAVADSGRVRLGAYAPSL